MQHAKIDLNLAGNGKKKIERMSYDCQTNLKE
jgi:hypothetical protein